jgi:hypothetical protein
MDLESRNASEFETTQGFFEKDRVANLGFCVDLQPPNYNNQV